MVRSTPLNIETLPSNSHPTVTSAPSAPNSWMPRHTQKQFSPTPPHQRKTSRNDCNDKPAPSQDKTLKQTQHSPAIGLMLNPRWLSGGCPLCSFLFFSVIRSIVSLSLYPFFFGRAWSSTPSMLPLTSFYLRLVLPFLDLPVVPRLFPGD